MKGMITNELIKTIRQPYLWIAFIIITLGCVGYAKSDRAMMIEEKTDYSWKKELQQETDEMQKFLDEDKMEYPGQKEEINEAIEMNNLRVRYDISDTDWRNTILIDYLQLNKESDKAKLYLGIVQGEKNWKDYYKCLKEDYEKALSENENEIEVGVSVEEINLRLDYDIMPQDSKDNWKNECLKEYLSNKTLISSYKSDTYMERDEKKIFELERHNKELLYRMKNNIKNDKEISYGAYLRKIINKKQFLILIVVFLTTLNICQEYMYNTWKNLFTQNKSRMKIVASKMFSMQILAFFICLFTILISLVVGSVFYEMEINDAVLMIGKSTININYILYLVIRYLLILLEISMYIIVTIVLGAFMENALMVLASMFFIEIGVPQLAVYLYENNKLLVTKYIPSLSFDLGQFLEGTVTVWGMRFAYSIVTLILCFVLGMISMKFIIDKEEF